MFLVACVPSPPFDHGCFSPHGWDEQQVVVPLELGLSATPHSLRTVPSRMTWLVTLKAPSYSGTWCGPILSLTTVRWLSTFRSIPLMPRSVVHQWRRTLISRCYYILLVAKLFLYFADDFPELLRSWTNLLHSFNSGRATIVTVRGLQFCFLVTLEFHS